MSALYGLVVCGGESSRMGTDKSLLEYYGQPQRNYVFHMLQPFCTKVLMSCNHLQSLSIPSHYNPLPDSIQYEHIGPMAALLTAFDLYPGIAFLVVGCDYPFLKSSDIQYLVQHRRPGKMATSYYNHITDFYEPLLAIYEPDIQNSLLENLGQGKHSLQHLLKETDAEQVYPLTIEAIKSIDSREQHEQALAQIKSAGF